MAYGFNYIPATSTGAMVRPHYAARNCVYCGAYVDSDTGTLLYGGEWACKVESACVTRMADTFGITFDGKCDCGECRNPDQV